MKQKKALALLLTGSFLVGSLLVGFFLFSGQKQIDSQPVAQEERATVPPAGTKPAAERTRRMPRLQDRTAADRSPLALPTDGGQGMTFRGKPAVDAIIHYLTDPSHSEEDKIAMVEHWEQPESRQEAMALLGLLRLASEAQQQQLEDVLLQLLAATENAEALATYLLVARNELPGTSLQELPKNIQAVLLKVVREAPSSDAMERVLAEHAATVPQGAAPNPGLKMDHPVMSYYRAQAADNKGDAQLVATIVQAMEQSEGQETVAALMRIGKEKIAPVEMVAEVAHNWVANHPGLFDQERYAQVLSDSESDPAERSIAAIALAAAGNQAQALKALEKAYQIETLPDVRSYLRIAIDHLQEPTK